MSESLTNEVTLIPFGQPSKITEFSKQNPLEYLATFSEVKNKVLIVNPKIYFPFPLQEGESTPLGLFVQEVGTKSNESLPTLEILPWQTRSALLGRAIFKDDEGNTYRDVDIKGIGYLKTTQLNEKEAPKPSNPFPQRRTGSRSGLLEKETAIYDYENAEDLINEDARVTRTIAIIELQELIANGLKISVEDAQKKGIIDKKFVPVLEVRAFGTRARISDIIDPDKTISQLLIEDAKDLVAHELGKEKITTDEYLAWFVKKLAESIAIIKKNGWYHAGLHDQNITLDARIVDFDSLKMHRPWHLPPLNPSDFDFAKDAIIALYNKTTGDNSHTPLYKKHKPPQDLSRYLSIYENIYKSTLKT